MTLAIRMGWPEGRHQSVGKWPRLGHMLTHLERSGRYAALDAESRAILPLLLEHHTLDYIAKTMGPGWTRSRVEYRAHLLMQRFCLSGPLTHSRLALVGIAAGVKPCWCEA